MKKLVPLILGLALSGCSLSNHSDSEKKWFAGLIGCTVADIFTTRQVLNKEGYEMNSIYGKKPDDKSLILAKSSGIGLLYAGGQLHPDKRELLYKIGTYANCGTTLWNYSQMKEKKIDAGLKINF